jgi:hypothetical protein
VFDLRLRLIQRRQNKRQNFQEAYNKARIAAEKQRIASYLAEYQRHPTCARRERPQHRKADKLKAVDLTSLWGDAGNADKWISGKPLKGAAWRFKGWDRFRFESFLRAAEVCPKCVAPKFMFVHWRYASCLFRLVRL